jgi:hypothetical protein
VGAARIDLGEVGEQRGGDLIGPSGDGFQALEQVVVTERRDGETIEHAPSYTPKFVRAGARQKRFEALADLKNRWRRETLSRRRSARATTGPERLSARAAGASPNRVKRKMPRQITKHDTLVAESSSVCATGPAMPHERLVLHDRRRSA